MEIYDAWDDEEDIAQFAQPRAIESEAQQVQEPAGEIIMYAPYGKLSAPFARPEWRGGALPPVGTKLYTAPQPPAPCQNSTDMEYCRAECEKLQAKVGILDGLSQDAINGGWTYRGMEAYAKGLEAKVAEQAAEIERLTGCLSRANDQAEHFEREWYLRGDTIAQQSALINKLERCIECYIVQFESECKALDEKAALIEEQCQVVQNFQQDQTRMDALIEKCGASIELFLERVEAPDASCSCCIRPPCNDCVEYGGLREALQDGKEALAAIASHKKGIAK